MGKYPKTMLLIAAFQLPSFVPAHADQWGSVVLAHCYELDGTYYHEHFFARVFWTQLGGGQLHSRIPTSEGPKRLDNLIGEPVTCLINGKKVSLEAQDYRAATIRGACGSCEQVGFRLTVDGVEIWESPAPKRRGDPIFKGTIDMDRDSLRVCEEHRPEAIGVEIPYAQNFFSARTSVTICREINY